MLLSRCQFSDDYIVLEITIHIEPADRVLAGERKDEYVTLEDDRLAVSRLEETNSRNESRLYYRSAAGMLYDVFRYAGVSSQHELLK